MCNFDDTDLAIELGNSIEKKNLISFSLNGYEVIEITGESSVSYTVCCKAPWKYKKGEQEKLKLVTGTLISKILPPVSSFLIVGLGNRLISSDALGPLTIDRLTPSRHIRGVNDRLFYELGGYELACISPGVEGQSGIESFDIVSNALQLTSSRAVILIDALRAREPMRVMSTVQLSSNGIMPGGGVGNHKRELSFNTLGVPVCTVGVPTVALPSSLSRERCYNEDYFIVHREQDIALSFYSRLISDGISYALGQKE
ncbi:MAG: GPR endopeptidase [Clostridia bacterium]|nr:GPR endopeptidase [Clostridia bacterium]